MRVEPIFFRQPLTGCQLVSPAIDHPEVAQIASPSCEKPVSTPQLIETHVSQPAINSTAPAETVLLLEKISKQLDHLASFKQSLVSQFQELAVALGVEIATAVVKHDVSQSADRINRLLQGLVDSHQSQLPLVVYVNQGDWEKLRIEHPDSSSSDSRLQWRVDDAIQAGDCRVESGERIMIANWQDQLAEIHLQIMECLQDVRVEDIEI